MTTQDTQHEVAPNTPRVEPDGVSIRAVYVFCGVLILTLILVQPIIVWLTRMQPADRVTEPAPLPVGLHGAQHWVDAPGELAAIREQEEQKLSRYAWVDRERGIVRIPIERAMQLMAQRSTDAHASTETREASHAP